MTLLPASRHGQTALAVFSGALSVLCFAPYRLFWLMPLLLAVLFALSLQQGRSRDAAKLGAWWGLAAYTANFYWIYLSLHDIAGMPAWLAGPMTLLLPAYLCLYPALALGLAHRLGPRHALWTLPAAWTLGEWLRGWVMTGFPWGNIGYSQVPDSPLAGWTPLGGVYLLSVLTAFSAVVLAQTLRHGLPRRALAVLLLAWLGGAALKPVSWTQPAGKLDVALLQGNIPQQMKWQPEAFAHTLDTYHTLLRQYPAKLVILPETAIPMFAEQVPAGILPALGHIARAQGSELVTGIPYQHPGQSEVYYNAALALTSAQPVYGKDHLVPFGEFVPLPWLTGWVYRYMNMPLAGFTSGGQPAGPHAVGRTQGGVQYLLRRQLWRRAAHGGAAGVGAGQSEQSGLVWPFQRRRPAFTALTSAGTGNRAPDVARHQHRCHRHCAPGWQHPGPSGRFYRWRSARPGGNPAGQHALPDLG